MEAMENGVRGSRALCRVAWEQQQDLGHVQIQSLSMAGHPVTVIIQK